MSNSPSEYPTPDHIAFYEYSSTPVWEDVIQDHLCRLGELLGELRPEGDLARVRGELVDLSGSFASYLSSPHGDEKTDLARDLHANVNHQVGNFFMMTHLALLQLEQGTEDPDSVNALCQRVRRRLDHILQTKFDFSQDDFERASLYNAPLMLWCEEVSQRLEAYRRGGLSFQMGDLLALGLLTTYVRVHPGIVALILQELVLNAEKAYDEIPVQAALVQARVYEDRFALQVTDGGRGMTAAEQERMFDRGVSGANGTGLGLWQVRRLAAAFGAELHCLRSAPGEGTVMELVVPLYCPLSTSSSNVSRARA